MKRRSFWIALLAALMVPVAGCAEEAQTPVATTGAAEYDAGIDYERVTPPLPGSGDGKVQVTEFFWYGCPHCYQFEPYLNAWLKSKPDYIEFRRVPAIFNNPAWELHARAFYTAEVLDVLDQIHGPLFAAMHEGRQRLNTRDALKAFFADHGVDAAAFDRTFDSFAVESHLRRARDLTQRSGIGGVPATMIDGRFKVEAGMAATFKKLIETTAHLAAQVHAEQTQGASSAKAQ